MTDGAGLVGLLTSWFPTAGRTLSPSAGPLILFYHFQLQPWPRHSTLVPPTPAHDDCASLQRNVLAAPWGSKKLRLVSQKVGGSISAGSWQCNFLTAWYSLASRCVDTKLLQLQCNILIFCAPPLLHVLLSAHFLMHDFFLHPFSCYFCIWTHIRNSLSSTPVFVLLKITQQSLPSVIYACQNTTL